ncbi:DNA cytosine methyltransferase [Halosquirtibacter xylanolyticus]|uniref:DNA cytosine methyltransferase n=1 Tax=Halosquirtibacter xylanolyticus TaxID=3374599 RepID=UPI003747FD07|nr:DNA cytosine methyltransferase [Prolixibacteraceae bacterium]
MSNYRYIDLFSGAGGISIGFGNHDFHLELANDIFSDALNTLKYNLKHAHPETDPSRVILGDIKELYNYLNVNEVEITNESHLTLQTNKDARVNKQTASIKENKQIEEIVSSIRDIDVLVGGPPCQGFSLIGRAKKATKEERMKGFIDDPRNQLFKYFLKFADKLAPKIVLIENVKGLASASKYRDLIEETLRNTGVGYDVSSTIINAKYFGIPQNRERIFFIGLRRDISNNHDISAVDIFNNIIENNKSEDILTLNDAIKDLPEVIANPLKSNYEVKNEIPIGKIDSFGQNISSEEYSLLIDDNNKSKYTNIINTYKGKDIKTKYLFNHKARYNNERDLFIYKNLAHGKYLDHPDNEMALSKVPYGIYYDEQGKRCIRNFTDKYFKLDPNKPSKTIIAHLEVDGNSYVHPGDKPRSITPREAARIQSFPDWYFFTGTTRKQLKQIGNAVPPLLASYFAQEFKRILLTIDENNNDTK